MNIGVDCETKGLNTHNFIMGGVKKEGQKKFDIFYEPSKMWTMIKELGDSELKREKILNVYAHNRNFDFTAYGDWSEQGLKPKSIKPFIVSLCKDVPKTRTFKDEKVYKLFLKRIDVDKDLDLIKKHKKTLTIDYMQSKEVIKFLDTFNIFPMPLEDAGEIIGYSKKQTPDYLKDDENGVCEFDNEVDKRSKFVVYNEVRNYMERDIDIVIKLVEYIKDKLKKGKN